MQKIHNGYNYDQSAINAFLTRHPVNKDYIVIVDQDGDFGLKHVDQHGHGHAVKETFNSFLRSFSLDDEVKSWYPFIDKWTHISRLPKLHKNAMAYLWLSAIKHYPVRISEFSITTPHYEILPRPYDEAEWKMASPTTEELATEKPTTPCPPCTEWILPASSTEFETIQSYLSDEDYYLYIGFSLGILFSGEIYFSYRMLSWVCRMKIS